jgi:hypothetical protein
MIEGQDFVGPVEEDLARLGSELRRLPTPMPSQALLDRVRRHAHLELAGRADEKLNRLVLAFLLAFSWIMSLVVFGVVRLLSGESLDLLGIARVASVAGRTGLSWSVIYFAAAWISGAMVLVLLGLHHRKGRRMA